MPSGINMVTIPGSQSITETWRIKLLRKLSQITISRATESLVGHVMFVDRGGRQHLIQPGDNPGRVRFNQIMRLLAYKT